MRPRRTNKRDVPEWASCSESKRLPLGVTNTMYGAGLVTLAQFARASNIAESYQEFRITSCKWVFKPHYDTFAVSADALTSMRVPQFYHMIDKAQALPSNTGLTQLLAMGAKPRRFDDKNIRVVFSPSVLTTMNAGAGLAPVSSKPVTSPWLSTNIALNSATFVPSAINHAGLFYYLDAGGIVGDGRYEYTVELEVQFQFRKPLIPSSNLNPPALNPFTETPQVGEELLTT